MATFTGNPSLLIAAAMLQDLLVDKDGTPMAGGTITCFHDNNRRVLKNWYYQSSNFADSSGNYTFSALPNPLTLSAAGTITDINGVDTIPFFYPFSETDQFQKDAYYITIVNHAQTNQITRANFPYINVVEPLPPPIFSNSFNNLITNSGFWRNIAPNVVNTTPQSVTLDTIVVNTGSLVSAIVAPSQHDGFRYPDIQFFKNNTTAVDTLTFVPFPLSNTQPVTNIQTNSPEYYISHVSSANGSSGETVKYYQIPIALHVNSLEAVPFTVSIQAQNGSATPCVMQLQIFQDTGTGTTSPAATLIQGATITLNAAWTTYIFTDLFPGTQGLALSQGADDALYLLISLPINAGYTANFTKPSIYLGTNVVPNYDYETYDKANSVFNCPRTGDIRIAVNPFYNSTQKWVYGWLPMNDGTICNIGGVVAPTGFSITRQNQDVWQLYNLLWNAFKVYDTGSNFNPICQMYTKGTFPGTPGIKTNYGASAYADFVALNQLAITSMMGKVILGTAPASALIPLYKSTFTGAATTITVTDTSKLFNGMPVAFTGTVTLSIHVIYYIGIINSTTFHVYTTFANAITGTSPQTVDASGTFVAAVTGTGEGEYAHTQLVAELALHNHASLAGNFVNDSGSLSVSAGNPIPAYQNVSATTADRGSSTPFNVTQPGVFYNIFIKL